MTRITALCVACLLFLCFVSLHSAEPFASDNALTLATARTYSRDIDRLIALLANRVKHLMPSKAESKTVQSRQTKAKALSQLASTPPKQSSAIHSPTEHFQTTSDPQKAFDNINRLAQTPTQLTLRKDSSSAPNTTPGTASDQQHM